MDTSYFYTSSAEVLASCHEKRDDISVVLDEDDGFAPRLSKICKKMCVKTTYSHTGTELSL